jgi:hypothetical protein
MFEDAGQVEFTGALPSAPWSSRCCGETKNLWESRSLLSKANQLKRLRTEQETLPQLHHREKERGGEEGETGREWEGKVEGVERVRGREWKRKRESESFLGSGSRNESLDPCQLLLRMDGRMDGRKEENTGVEGRLE